MSELYDQDAEDVYGEIRKVYGELRPNVWVDTETGAWGTDITSVKVLRLTDAEDMTHFVSLSDDAKADLAAAFGLPLQMIGCTDYHNKE